MRKYSIYKEQAILLRKKGHTYSEIRKLLGVPVPKSTLSTWCHKILMSAEYEGRILLENKLHLQKIRQLSGAAYIAQRNRFLTHLRTKNAYLQKEIINPAVLKTILAMLYWGEGSKWKSHRGLMLGNSDPDIIRLYISLLTQCYGIPPENMKCRISYRDDQDINTLENYWSQLIGIPLANFYKTKPDPRTIGIPTRRSNYYGVCVIMCAGASIQLELDIIARMIVKWVAK